jgi:lysophospholipase L1-like esterase
MLGDSLAEQVSGALRGTIPGATLVVEAIYGLTANDAIPATQRLLANGPAAVVVVLGTNDARDGATAGDDIAAVRRVAERLQGVPCIRWMSINEASRFPAMNVEAHAINAELRRLSATEPHFGVVPWASEIAGHPSWLLPDGLHHSAEGQAAFARRIRAAFQDCRIALTADR